MNPALSWLIILLIFAAALVGVEHIGRFFDWVLDHMGWGIQTQNLSPLIGTDDCPCEHDRHYHSRQIARLSSNEGDTP